MATTIDPNLLQQIIDQFGIAVGQSIVPYLPAIKTFTMAELLAFANSLNQKSLDAALLQVHNKMSADDLVAEATQLADLTAQMADTNAAKAATAKAIMEAILKAALQVILGLLSALI